MSIILLILKIIGILLLVILSILLLVIAAVLFAPVSYRVIGSAQEKDIHVRVRCGWLMGIIGFRGEYEEEFISEFRIFGFPLGKKKEGKANKPKQDRMQEVKVPIQSTADAPQEEHSQSIDDEPIKVKVQGEKVRTDRFMQKPKRLFQKIKAFPGMIKSKLERLKEKIKNITELVLRIKEEIQDQQNREAVKVVFEELKRLLKHIAPRKVKADISFGMEDPAGTGQILGVISTLPFVYRYKLRLCPDFETEQTYFNGSFDIKGHIRSIHLLTMCFHFIKDKNIRRLIKRFHNS